MFFDVTYRNPKTGAKEVLRVEAASKTELWAVLKARGITAVSVSEAAAKKYRRPAAAGAPAPSKMRGILAAAVVVLGAGLAALFLLPGERKAPEKKAVKKAEVAKKDVRREKPAAKPAAEMKVEKKEVVDPAKQRVETLSFVTNSMGMIVERYRTADGKTHKLIRPSKPPLFKHMTDDLISMAMCTSGGGQMPPLPLSGNLDKEFLESLKDPIVINPDDPEEIKERKRIVAETRKQIDALMRQGISFRAILAEHEKVFNENAEIRAEARAELQKICDEGDKKGVEDYLKTINAAFQEMGIEELQPPKTKEERRAEREARRAAREAAKQKGSNP